GQRLALGVGRERGAERGPARLAVDLDGVVARMRPEYGAAARPDRRAGGTGAGAAGALLAPRLGATAGDFATRPGGVGAVAAGVELRPHGLVDQRHVEARLERGRVQGGGAAAELGRGPSHRCAPPPWSRSARVPRRGRARGYGWP